MSVILRAYICYAFLQQTNISKIVLDNDIVHGCHNEFHLLCIGSTGKMSIDLLVIRLVE